MENSVDKWRFLNPYINKIRNRNECHTRKTAGFSKSRKLPPEPTLPCGLSPAETSLAEINLWNKWGSPSECSEIIAVVSSITDNL